MLKKLMLITIVFATHGIYGSTNEQTIDSQPLLEKINLESIKIIDEHTIEITHEFTTKEKKKYPIKAIKRFASFRTENYPSQFYCLEKEYFPKDQEDKNVMCQFPEIISNKEQVKTIENAKKLYQENINRYIQFKNEQTILNNIKNKEQHVQKSSCL